MHPQVLPLLLPLLLLMLPLLPLLPQTPRSFRFLSTSVFSLLLPLRWQLRHQSQEFFSRQQKHQLLKVLQLSLPEPTLLELVVQQKLSLPELV